MKNPNFSFALWEWEHAPRREEVVAAAITSYVQARLSRPGPYGGIDINELLAKQPKRRAARYRNLAEVRRTIVAELCDAGYSQKEVGQVFGGRSQASISVLLNPVCLECFRSMHTRSRGVCGSCYRRHLAAGDYADVGELKGTQHGNHAFHWMIR